MSKNSSWVGDGRIAENTFREKKKPDLTDDACSDAFKD